MNFISALFGKIPGLTRGTVIFSRKHRVIATVYILIITTITFKMLALALRSPEQKDRDFQKIYNKTKSEQSFQLF